MDFLVLQLADSAFPIGGFVHSQGLEAASSFGVVPDVDAFFAQAAWQTGFGALPFVHATATGSESIATATDECDAFLLNPIQRRASAAQGRNLLRVAKEAFGAREDVASFVREAETTTMHLAPVFGGLARALAITPSDATRVFLHSSARNVLSAAVRLGRLGPLEAQRVLAERASLLEAVHARCGTLAISDAAQTSPVLDLFAGLHDRLYTRLFQS
ncbi:MAG TPA: urease accessory UreF family protein [Polyangiaceae bacterium]